jgi:hypothetical protein
VVVEITVKLEPNNGDNVVMRYAANNRHGGRPDGAQLAPPGVRNAYVNLADFVAWALKHLLELLRQVPPGQGPSALVFATVFR